MIEIIRPIPAHLDAEQVQRLAGMKPELVRAYMHEYRMQRMVRTDRLDRDRADRGIEAATFVLSECEPIDVRLQRELASGNFLQQQLAQHRAIVAEMEARMAEHHTALARLSAIGSAQEVAA